MGIAVVLIDADTKAEIPIERGTPAWSASLEWARFHGLDPNMIPSGSDLIRDALNRRVVYETFVLDETGRIKLDGGLDPVTVVCVEQGEAPPLPFPADVWGG